MEGLMENFLHGHPSVYDVGSFVAIMILLLVCLGLNLSLKAQSRRITALETRDGNPTQH
jgi:hypothetical protein